MTGSGAGWGEQHQKQIPFEDDNQKSNDNDKSKTFASRLTNLASRNLLVARVVAGADLDVELLIFIRAS
jgi:hypothetical protein